MWRLTLAIQRQPPEVQFGLVIGIEPPPIQRIGITSITSTDF